MSISAAFATTYVDKWLNIPRLSRFVEERCQEYYSDMNSFVSPYTSIVQASGSGKSRLLREYANYTPCIYLCLGSGQCFPRPSEIVRDELIIETSESDRKLGERKMNDVLVRLLAAAFTKAADVNWDPIKFIECQAVGLDSKSPDNQIEAKFKNDIKLSPAVALKRIIDAAPKSAKYPTMVLILDEARGLLNEKSETVSAFRIFRRAWADLAQALKGKGIQIFALLTDTTSRVANFSPSTNQDSSLRFLSNTIIEPGPTRLLKPYFMVTNMDIFVQSGYPRTSDEAFAIENIVRRGRPIWYVTLASASDSENGINTAFKLARRKVSCGANLTDMKGNLYVISMAALGMRVVLDVHSYGALAETLSSASMRCITSISESRDAVLTEYPSDPILSHAASMITSQYQTLRPSETLRNLFTINKLSSAQSDQCW